MPARSLVIMVEDRWTHDENTFPKMFTNDLSEDPRAGRPQELQSGPMQAIAFGCILKPIHSASLGTQRIFLFWNPLYTLKLRFWVMFHKTTS